jgi:hypothetical protein
VYQACGSESYATHNDFVAQRRDEYYGMKMQWTSMTKRQLERNHHMQEQIMR